MVVLFAGQAYTSRLHPWIAHSKPCYSTTEAASWLSPNAPPPPLAPHFINGSPSKLSPQLSSGLSQATYSPSLSMAGYTAAAAAAVAAATNHSKPCYTPHNMASADAAWLHPLQQLCSSSNSSSTSSKISPYPQESLRSPGPSAPKPQPVSSTSWVLPPLSGSGAVSSSLSGAPAPSSNKEPPPMNLTVTPDHGFECKHTSLYPYSSCLPGGKLSTAVYHHPLEVHRVAPNGPKTDAPSSSEPAASPSASVSEAFSLTNLVKSDGGDCGGASNCLPDSPFAKHNKNKKSCTGERETQWF